MPERREDLGTKHQLHGVQPVLPVEDVAASAAYFRDMLGFDVDFLVGNPPIHARVMKGDRTYGDPVYIHLSAAPPESVRPSGEIRIHVGRDIDGLYEAYQASGIVTVEEPQSHSWGLREFSVRESNGHVIRFRGYLEDN